MEFSPFFPLNSKKPFQKHSRGTFRPFCNTEIRGKRISGHCIFLLLLPMCYCWCIAVYYVIMWSVGQNSGFVSQILLPPVGVFPTCCLGKIGRRRRRSKKNRLLRRILRTQFVRNGEKKLRLFVSIKKEEIRINCAKFGKSLEVATH